MTEVALDGPVFIQDLNLIGGECQGIDSCRHGTVAKAIQRFKRKAGA